MAATILTAVIVAAAALAAVVQLVKTRKAGGSCSGGCASCPMGGACAGKAKRKRSRKHA